jgi:precorrin-2 dehydrogenase/sirohydrochlorin ferrochelatase
MSLFPLFLKLEGRRCLVVGAGVIAESKIQSLLDAGSEVYVVAPDAVDAVKHWAETGVIRWEQRRFESNDLEGAVLVITATSAAEVNEEVFQQARRRGILCNSVDDPERCDFYYGAVVRRGDLQVAISTAGHSPALAQRLRLQLETQFGPEYATWLDQLARAREQLFKSNIDAQERKATLHRLASQESFEAAHSASAHLVTKEQGSL